MNDIQRKEFEILRQVDTCCRELGIRYFMCGGTLIGAVRHKGFIPWDDDIDIGMSRENYERFVREAPSWLEGRNLFLQHITTEETDPFPYVKVRMNGTKFVEFCNRNVSAHQGIYIDVFPFDYAPASRSEQVRQFRKVKFWDKLFPYRQIPDITQRPENIRMMVKYIVRRLIHYALRPVSIDFIYRKLTEAMTMSSSNPDSGFCTCWLVPKMKVYRSCTMNDVVTLKFEDGEFYAPANYDEYLTEQYGDYMTPPPENERTGHQPYILSLGE